MGFNSGFKGLIIACHGLSPCMLWLSFLRTVLREEARQDKMLLLYRWPTPGAVSTFWYYCYAPFMPIIHSNMLQKCVWKIR